jgi:CO dehydrogenase/acetyl-CoA synthase epsilon subunit
VDPKYQHLKKKIRQATFYTVALVICCSEILKSFQNIRSVLISGIDVRNIISFANLKKNNYLTRFDEI